jgi:hypothetical protein
MLKTVASLLVTLAFTTLAHAGLPGDVIVDQTFACQQEIDGWNISLTGTLAPQIEEATGVPTHPQDFIHAVTGTVTLSIAESAPNVFSTLGVFMTLPVQGSLHGGVPSFAKGQGYKLFNNAGAAPGSPVLASLTISEEDGVKKASFRFEGQTTETAIDCQLINFELLN